MSGVAARTAMPRGIGRFGRSTAIGRVSMGSATFVRSKATLPDLSCEPGLEATTDGYLC